jgi:pyruvate dehydrogenase E1 component
MSDDANVKKNPAMDEAELKDWLASLDYVLNSGTPDRVQFLLQQLQIRAQESGVTLPFTYNTPYIKTIPKAKQPAFPGNRECEGQ